MNEFPVYPKAWKKGLINIDLLFPNKYFGGAYHLGMHILYNLIMNHPRYTATKVYSDEGKLTSNLIGITISYERDYERIKKILKKNNVPLHKNRNQIIFCGGPAVTLNSKPVEDYVDFIVLGDAELILPTILEAYHGQDKATFLEEIKHVQGVYIPGKNTRTLAELKHLDDAPYPLYQPLPQELTRNFVFGNTFMLEIERSCPYHCSFCVIPATNKQQKVRSLASIKKIIDEGIKINKRTHVTIYSPAFTHPERKEILKYLLKKNLTFSIPSLRVEGIDDELLELINAGGQHSITLAPEAPERLRTSVNKYIKDKVYEEVIQKAKAHGMQVKLYMMIGLPGMTTEDIEEMATWLNKLGCYASINPLVPKKTTALEHVTFDKATIKQQIELLQKKLHVPHKIANLDTSYEEYLEGMHGYI